MESSSIKKDLQAIQEKIRRVQIEYDCFFAGSRDCPPFELQDEIETCFAKYRGRAFQRYEDGFLYNSLLGSYMVYRELYEKRLRRQELGADSQTVQREMRTLFHSDEAAPNDATPACEQSLQELYDQYVEAKLESGQSIQALTLEKFRLAIEKKTQDIVETKGCGSIRFRIQVQNGNVKVLANPVKE